MFSLVCSIHSNDSHQCPIHSSIIPKFLGSMYFSAKGDAPSPMQIPFLQIQCLLASCLLCAYCCCCLHSTYSTYQLACIIWQAGRLGDKIESQEYKCKMPWTESTTTTTDTKVQFEKNSPPFEVFLDHHHAWRSLDPTLAISITFVKKEKKSIQPPFFRLLHLFFSI